MPHLPNISLFMTSIRVEKERLLQSRSRVAVPAPLLRHMLQSLAEAAPFSADFYLATYADVRAAHEAGDVSDPHRHFLEVGYFEGRIGAEPEVDEAYYAATYPDVATAIHKQIVKSGKEHYMRSGMFEGRIPNRKEKPSMETWMMVMKPD